MVVESTFPVQVFRWKQPVVVLERADLAGGQHQEAVTVWEGSTKKNHTN